MRPGSALPAVRAAAGCSPSRRTALHTSLRCCRTWCGRNRLGRGAGAQVDLYLARTARCIWSPESRGRSHDDHRLVTAGVGARSGLRPTLRQQTEKADTVGSAGNAAPSILPAPSHRRRTGLESHQPRVWVVSKKLLCPLASAQQQVLYKTYAARHRLMMTLTPDWRELRWRPC
jgi:hypothetical protein